MTIFTPKYDILGKTLCTMKNQSKNHFHANYLYPNEIDPSLLPILQHPHSIIKIHITTLLIPLRQHPRFDRYREIIIRNHSPAILDTITDKLGPVFPGRRLTPNPILPRPPLRTTTVQINPTRASRINQHG